MPITLPRETLDRLTKSIRQFAAKELEQDIGDLKAGFLLDFCLKEIGPTVYNRAIADAQAFLQDRLADLEGVCYEPEFTYWTSTGSQGTPPSPRKGRPGR